MEMMMETMTTIIVMMNLKLNLFISCFSHLALLIFACDTETVNVDPTSESPVGKGEIVCFSLFAGPGGINFAKLANTVELKEIDIYKKVKKANKSQSVQDIKSTRLWVDTTGDEGRKVNAGKTTCSEEVT
eukprot:756011-Hanusia_phi.AAC.4